jgi:hypothetical protein
MKKILVLASLVLVATLGLAGLAQADQLAVAGSGLDPVLISASGFTMSQTSGGASTIDNLVLLFSVAIGSAAPSGLTSSAGTVGAITLAGNMTGSASCGNPADVYSCAGITGGNNSNNLTNFNGALTTNSLPTASSFDIYEVTITGADLGAKGSITIGGTLGIGTFIDGYGVGESGDVSFTPFTVAGLTTGTSTPEPASMLLLGLGLAGVPFLRRKK